MKRILLSYYHYLLVIILTGLLVSSTHLKTSTSYTNNNTNQYLPIIGKSCIPNAIISQEDVPFYHLRIEYRTYSDWTELAFAASEDILSMRMLSVEGYPANSKVYINDSGNYIFELNRPVEDVYIEPTVAMTVDLALAPGAITTPINMIQQKGAWFETNIRISQIMENSSSLIYEHTFTEEYAEFALDLTPLESKEPKQVWINHYCPDPNILAIYYGWWDCKPWMMWEDPRFTDHPLIRYSCDDPIAAARHIQQALDAGIDGFATEWLGPHLDTDENLNLLLTAAQNTQFKLAVYLDISGIYNLDNVQEIIHDWLLYIITTYGNHPSYMQVNNKPLIIIFDSDLVKFNIWKNVFDQLNQEGEQATYWAYGLNVSEYTLFDGVHKYLPSDYSILAQDYQEISRATTYYPLLDPTANRKYWSATVIPGFDNRPIDGDIIVDRDDGEYYRQGFEIALQFKPEWLFITSWNEYQENTQIEPSELYSYQYLLLTLEYSHILKGK
jgi:hypothetical protein